MQKKSYDTRMLKQLAKMRNAGISLYESGLEPPGKHGMSVREKGCENKRFPEAVVCGRMLGKLN